MIRGARTWADAQEYLIPPQVRPMIARPVPTMAMMLPLEKKSQQHKKQGSWGLTSNPLGQACYGQSLPGAGQKDKHTQVRMQSR